MAKRFTDTDKWDDDWFLSLPPRFKCVWEYLRDTCSGAGIKKISFANISSMVKETITREDFDQHIGDRVQWLNHETLWVHGFIKAQYKKLSANNRAHVNIAKLALRETENIILNPKAQAVVDNLIKFIETIEDEASEAQPSLGRPPDEAQPSLIGNRKKEKGKEFKKGGVGEKSEQVKLLQTLQEIYQAYPRKEGKSKGIAKLAKDIKSEKDLADLSVAVSKYTTNVKGKDPDFIKHFSTFASEWRDWVDFVAPKTPPITEAAHQNRDQAYWLAQAQVYFDAIDKFGRDEWEQAREYLTEARMEPLRYLGGMSKIRDMPRHTSSVQHVANRLKEFHREQQTQQGVAS